MSQNFIELNGKRYDATSGAYLGKSAHPAVQAAMHGRVIDGFQRPAAKAVAAPAKPAPAKHMAAKKAVPAPHHTHHAHTPKPVKAHHPEHAKTLIRRTVHKPETTLKPAIKTQAPAEVMAKPHSALARKASAFRVDQSRLERAAHTPLHKTIRHFRPAHLAVATHTVVQDVPVIAVRAAPAPETHPAPTLTKHHDIFEAAIAHATSHEQPTHTPRSHRRKRRVRNALAFTGAFLIIGGFIGYLNVPNIEMRVASIQAGFSASRPGYTPTGYALEGGIQRSGGTVSLSFRSGDSHYTITQQASDWNSQTLLDNTLALSGAHDIIQKNGQTIYIYGNGANASWVNGGVRYDITGNAQLNKNDLATIATSL